MNRVILSPEYFPNPTIGRPVSNGNLYVGIVDLDPEVEANRQEIFLQEEDGTIVPIGVASQPIQTGAGGVPLYNGSPVTILTEGDYSLKVTDKQGAQVYYVPSDTTTEDAIASGYLKSGLTANPGFIESVVVTVGRTTAGDGGEGTFYWIATADLTATDDAIIARDTLEGVYVASTGGYWKRLFTGAVNVKWFGAKGDGATDDTLAINVAYDAIRTDVYIPAGIYEVTALNFITNTATVFGDSEGTTIIEGTTLTDDIITFGQDGVNTAKCGLNNLSVRYNKTAGGGDKTSGAHVVIKEQSDFFMHNVAVYNWWNGIMLLGGSNIYLTDIILYNGGRSVIANRGVSAVYHSAGVSSLQPTSVYITRVDMETRNTAGFISCQDGFYYNASDSIYMTDCHVFRSNVGIHVEADATADFFVGLWVNNCYFDISPEYNLQFSGAATSYEDIIFTGCEFRAGELIGVFFQNSAIIKGVTFNGCHFRKAGTYSILCNSTGGVEELVVSNCTFKLTNNDGDTGNISDVVYGNAVNGVIHSNNVHSGGEATAGKCVTFQASTDNIVAVGNNFGLSDNLTGINDLSVTANKVIANNL